MQEQVDRVAGTPTEAGMLALRSVAAAYAGRTRAARDLASKAIDLAMQRGLKEGASEYSAGQALWEAAYGNCAHAKDRVARTLAIARGRHVLSWSALALALCGEASGAQGLVDEMARRFPRDSFIKGSWLPMTRAALETQARRPAQAIEILEVARRAETGDQAALWPAYLRGLAYLDQGALSDADAEFQKVLDHKGVLVPAVFNPVPATLYPLAHLAKARAAARMGHVDESRKAYEALFELWKDADPDVPVLRTARREHRQLTVTAQLRP
jgi:tetratricopeptide (TPR) repeat protein